jgi:hypothetical protein
MATAAQIANGNGRPTTDSDPRGRMLSLLSVMLAGTGAVGTTSGSTSGRGSDDADPNYSDENTPRESGVPSSRDSGDHELDAGTVEAAWAAYGNAGYPAHVPPHMAGQFTAQGVPVYIQAPYPQRPVPANYSVISTIPSEAVKPKRGAPKPLVTPAVPQQRKNNNQQQYFSAADGIGEAAFAVAGMKRRRKRNELGVIKRW